MSNSLRPQGLQHVRLPCPLLSPRVARIHVHWISDAANHLILCCPLLLLPSIFSSIRVFSSESTLRMRWPKYRSFNFSSIPSNECWGLIFFRVDSLQSKGLLRTFSSTKIQKHQLFSPQPSLWSNSHICIWLLEKP